MRRISIFILAIAVLTACAPKWTPLFDGSTLQGWTDVDGNEMPEGIWSVIDGAIVSHPDFKKDEKENLTAVRDLMTVGYYTNFKLKVSFRLGECSNGGIKYFINPGELSSPTIGFEFQVIDDDQYGVKNPPINNVQTTASLYDLLSANKKDANFDVYGWNEAMIVVKDGIVQHWLNGAKVLEIDRFSPAFDLLVKNSKFKNEKGFGKFPGGHIFLQDHGCKVEYRDIMIQEIK